MDAPHSQPVGGAKPHLCKQERECPTPVQYRFPVIVKNEMVFEREAQ